MNAPMATLVLGLLLGGGDAASKRDLQAMQGTWRPVAIEINGNKLEKGFENDRLTIKDGRFEMKAGKETMIGTITLDASKDPRHIDTHITAGANKGLKSIGIYHVTGERLLVCYCVPPNPRPTEFKSEQGSSRTLVVYERVKK